MHGLISVGMLTCEAFPSSNSNDQRHITLQGSRTNQLSTFQSLQRLWKGHGPLPAPEPVPAPVTLKHLRLSLRTQDADAWNSRVCVGESKASQTHSFGQSMQHTTTGEHTCGAHQTMCTPPEVRPESSRPQSSYRGAAKRNPPEDTTAGPLSQRAGQRHNLGVYTWPGI